MASPQSGFSSTDSRSNLEMLVFVEGGKPSNPEENSRCKDKNQQQTQPTHYTGIGNRTRATLVGKRVLSPLRHPCTMCELISSPSSGITPAYSLPTLQVALLAQLDTGSHPVIGKVRVQIPVIAEFSSSAFLYAYAYYVTARNQFTIFMYF